MNPNFTDHVTQAIQQAFAEAQRRNNTEVSENHLLHEKYPVGRFLVL